jgi:hypothetical protein
MTKVKVNKVQTDDTNIVLAEVNTGKANSFTFTIRPRNGVPQNGNLEQAIVKYCNKQIHSILVYEKDDHERHLHGQVWITRPVAKGDFKKQLLRIQQKNVNDWDDQQAQVFKGNGKKDAVKMAFNDDFWKEYLSKEDGIDGVNWLINNPPPEGHSNDFYPSQEDQEKIKNKANAVDSKFHKWKTDYEEWILDNPMNAGSFDGNSNVRHTHCAKFLADMMFKKKKYCVITDAKARKQSCNALFHYIYPSAGTYKLFLTEDDIEMYHTLKPQFSATPEDH